MRTYKKKRNSAHKEKGPSLKKEKNKRSMFRVLYVVTKAETAGLKNDKIHRRHHQHYRWEVRRGFLARVAAVAWSRLLRT